MTVIESWTDYGRGYEDGEEKTIDKVLEIIDKHGEQLVHSIVDGSYPEIKAADVLASVRGDVLDLKGGEMK